MSFNNSIKKCPIECSELDHIKLTLYGKDGLGGLVKCTKDKISKKALIIFLSLFLGVSSSFVLYGLASDASQKECLDENKAKIQILETNYNHLKEGQDEIKETLKDMKKDQLTKEDLRQQLETVRKAIKESKGK